MNQVQETSNYDLLLKAFLAGVFIGITFAFLAQVAGRGFATLLR